MSNLYPIFRRPNSVASGLRSKTVAERAQLFGLVILMGLLSLQVAFGQTTIYSTNFGAAAVNTTTLLAGPPAWTRSGANAANMQLATSTASSGYTGASGGANLIDNGGTGAGIVTTGNISTVGYSSPITLSIAYRQSSGTYTGVVLCEYSTNGGTSWNTAFSSTTGATPAAPINQTPFAAWYRTADQTLAGAAGISDLQIRFTFTRTATGGNIKFDDLIIQGAPSSPTLTVSTTSLPKYFANSTFASEGQSFTVAGNNLGSNNLTVGPLSGYEFSTSSTFASSSPSLSFTPSSGTVATTTVYARLLSSNAVGNYNGNIVVDAAGSGATAQNIAVTGQVYAAGSAFTAGNILTLRVGESAGPALTSASQPLFLDEYTPTGTFVQSVPLPFAQNALGANNRKFTMSGTSTSEGYLNLSPDGQYLTFAGYDAAPGVLAITGTSAATTNRVVARVTYNGGINTTTRIADGYDANNVRSAATVDGNAFWTGGAGTGGGARYVALGSTGTSTQLSTTITNTRGTAIYNSQLYCTSQSGSNIGVNTVGTGLPTTAGNTISILSGTATNVDLTNPHGFVFVDQDDNGTPDVMYVADANLGLVKFSNSSGTWTKRGSLPNTSGGAVYGLTAQAVGANRRIYLNLGTSSTIATEIYTFLDNSAITANIASNGTDIVAACGSPIVTASGNVGFKGVTFAPVFVPTPTVDHTFTTPAATVAQGNSIGGLYRIQCDVTNGAAILTGVTVQTAGLYAASDINNFKLIISTDGTLDAGDPVLATISSSTGPGQTLAFTGLGQSIPVGTRYLFVAAGVSGCATAGSNINITSTPLTAITYSNPATVKNGTPAAGSSVGIVLGVLDDVTGLTAPGGTPTIPVSWTNPACVTEVIIVAHTAPITGTPSGTYTGNNNYTLAPAFPGGGRVVYNGTTSPQTITGLTIGQLYYFKVFVRFAGNYSNGVQVSATPQLVNLYSRGSGLSHTDAIWSTSPTGTPVTLAAAGGLAIDRGIVIQNGHTVQLSQSGGTVLCRELIVNAGGTLTATGTTTSDNKFLNVFGDITNNGTIGTGTTYSPICFGIEGSTVTIKGNGVTNIGRIRKNTTTPNATSNLIINKNVNIRFTGGAALYTNQDATRLNILVNTGRTLNMPDATADLGLDGTALATGERSGNLIVNGTLIVGGTLFAQNNNAVSGNSCAVTVSGNGRILANNIFTDLALGQGTTFNIAAGGKVQLTGSLTVNSGTLNSNDGIILKSSASQTARIASSAGTISGNITAERYIPTAGWHFTGTSLAGQTITDWNDDLPTQGPMPGVETFNPGTHTSMIFEYDQAYTVNDGFGEINGWKVPTTSAITQYKGYRVFTAIPSLLTNTGTYTMNPGPIALDNSGSSAYKGWNLILNPHLSAINVAGITFGAAQNCVVVWNPSTEAYEYNGTLGPITGATLNNAITPIASGQGFLVYTPTSTSITIPQTAKTTANGTFFRTNTQQTGVELQLIDLNNKKDATVFQFLPEAQDTYEASLDVMKFTNPGLNVFTLSAESYKLAVQGLPFTGEQTTLKVGFAVPQAGSYTFKMVGLDLLNAASQAYLKDNETGSIYDLTVSPLVQFTVANAGVNTDRFELIFTQSVTGITPVKNMEVQVYPNPTSGSFVLAQSGLEGETTIEIRDVVGKLISTNVFTQLAPEVKLQAPEVAGRYTVTLRNAKGLVTKTILVK